MIHSQFREIGWTEWTRVTLRFFAYVCGSFVRSSSSLIPNLGKLVGLSGLEPPTSCLSGMRSNHLSYNPLSWRVRFLFFGVHFRGGGDDGIRTHDPLLAGQVLSQLSYTPIFE